MYNFICMFLDFITTKEDKIFAATGVLYGYVGILFRLDITPFSWQYFLSGFLGLCYMFLTGMVAVAGKKAYSWCEPKVIKFSKSLVVKFKKHGKERNNRKRA